MTYNPNIPQAADYISVSQGQVLTNFNQLNTIFNVDHVTFNAVLNNGKHNRTTYREQGADPATIADEIAVYSRLFGATSELFFRRESNGAIQQMTGIVPATVGTNYGVNAPDGIQWRFGLITHTAPSTIVTFTTPFATAIYSILATPVGAVANGAWNVQAITVNNFRFVGTVSGIAYYLATGR